LLAGARIENLTWQDMLACCHRPGPLFYLDPPYYKASFYNHNFELSDFEQLSRRLAGVKGQFILSINDHPEMRRVFGIFQVRPVLLSYSARKDKCTVGEELLIMN